MTRAAALILLVLAGAGGCGPAVLLEPEAAPRPGVRAVTDTISEAAQYDVEEGPDDASVSMTSEEFIDWVRADSTRYPNVKSCWRCTRTWTWTATGG